MDERRITGEGLRAFRRRLQENERSAATIEKYMRDIRAFGRFAGEEPLCKEMVIRYKQHLLDRYAAASVNSMLAAVNCFLKEQGWYDCVVKAVRVQRQTFRPRERELTRAEYICLLEAARQRKDRRLYLLMQSICATGIRVSELRFLTVEAVRTGRATVSLKGKNRQVLIPSALCRELRSYIKERGITAGSVFITKTGKPMDRSNILHAMKGLCDAAKVAASKVFPHNLRHLFATLYYRSSKDISRLADLLGHSSINTTRIYTCVSGAEQQRQIERLGLVIQNKNTA